MSRKVICTLLAVMLVVSMMAVAAICVSADDNKNSDSEAPIVDETIATVQTEPVESTLATEFSTTATGTTDPTGSEVASTTVDPIVHKLNLTVNATSNYFPETSAQYNPKTNEVTVTYNIKSSRNLLDTQWYLTYDPKILKVSDKTTLETVSPMSGTQGVQFDKSIIEDGVGYVKFAASNIRLYDISTKNAVYATIVFEINDIEKNAPVSTTVDLVVDVLRVSNIDTESAISSSEKEVLLIDNEVVLENSKTALVKVETATTITQSTYIEPATTEPTTTDATTVDPSGAMTTVENSAVTTTNPTVTAQTTQSDPSTVSTVAPATGATSQTGISRQDGSPSTADSKIEENTAIVKTGEASLAAIILVMVIIATCIMFILRKKEMYFE